MREFDSVLAEMTRILQPLQRQLRRCAVPHQHKLVDINVVLAITTVCLIMWQASMPPTRFLQGHNLAKHHYSYRYLWRGPGREAIDDQGRTARQ